MATIETTLDKEIRILKSRINIVNSMRGNIDKTLGFIARSMQENMDTLSNEYKNDPKNQVQLAKQRTYISGFNAIMNDYNSLVSNFNEELKIKEQQKTPTIGGDVSSGSGG